MLLAFAGSCTPWELFTDISLYASGSQVWFYVRPAELITLPLLSLSLRDPLEITIQHHFPARAAQRPVSGALVMGNYQLAQMKWPLEKTSQNISPSFSLSLSLSASLFRTTSLSIWFTLSLSLWEERLWNGVWKACQGATVLCNQHFAQHVLP